MYEDLFDSMVETATKAIPVNEGDYQQDGLWYCGKCRTPKQVRVEIFGHVKTPMCLCKCEAKRIDEEDMRIKEKERSEKVTKLRAAGFPDSDMGTWTFDTDDNSNPQIMNTARRYVEHFPKMKNDGKGLLLFGKVGTGKTFAAVCIANALIDDGRPCLVTSFARLVNQLQGMREGRQEFIDGLSDYDLLVLDDLASERNTEYMNEIVMNIIDSRYRSGLPLIVTTNLSAEELKNPADIHKQRIYSRLMEMCIPIEVKGIDRRKQKLRDGYSEYSTLLGLGG